jgi:hypothetical protein
MAVAGREPRLVIRAHAGVQAAQLIVGGAGQADAQG